MFRVAFVGAGSVEFTRDLVRDLFSFPELREIELSLHDIDEEPAGHCGAGREARSRQARRPSDHQRVRRPSAALEGADAVVNMIAVGGHAATTTDFDIPERYGLRQTIGDTIGIGGIFRGLRTFPVLAGIAADMSSRRARCVAAQLHEPDGDEHPVLVLRRSTGQGRRACATRCTGRCTTCASSSACRSRRSTSVSAGVNHQAWVLRWERDGQSLYPLLDQLIDTDPELRRRVRVDMYRRLGYYPTETSEHSSEYVPWYLRSAARGRAATHPVSATTSGSRNRT